MPAPFPSAEEQRLSALYRYEILDTLPEEAFNRITRVAAEVLEMPVAIVNFVDRDRQWGKACVGLSGSEAPRSDSFCAWTILNPEVLVIEHAAADPRFTDNPMVTGEPYIHLYAGAPLITPDGQHVGTLCVTDHRPHVFQDRECRVLRELAAIVMDELELRLTRRRLERSLDGHQRLLARLTASEEHARAVSEVWMLLEADLDPEVASSLGTDIVAQATGLDWVGVATLQSGVLRARTLWSTSALPTEWQHGLEVGVRLDHHHLSRAFLRGSATFLEESEAGWQREPVLGAVAARALCVVPLGRPDPAQPHLIGLRVSGRGSWSAHDRELFETGARQYELAMGRRSSAQA